MLSNVSRPWGWAIASACTVFIFVLMLMSLDIVLPYPSSPKSSPEAFVKQDAIEKQQESATPTSPPINQPGETGFRKTIVMGKLASQDTDWEQSEMSDWQSAIYIVDLAANESSSTGFKTVINKAKEATPYLTYLVDHYDAFPDIAVFIHAHRSGYPAAWHNDAKGYDAVNMLNELRTDIVLDRGYVNLRCVNEPGCPSEIDTNRNPPDPEKKAEIAYPYVYANVFNVTVEEAREQVPIVATQCCAQFAISRDQVLKRSKAFYAQALQLIKESDEYGDETLGTVFEYMWHILFGKDAVHCENQQQCWSIVYGRPDGWSPWVG